MKHHPTLTLCEWLAQLPADSATTEYLNRHNTKAYLCIFARDDEHFATLVRELGGHRTKNIEDGFLTVTRDFPHGRVQILFNRERACTKVQVGTRVETKEVLPPGVTLETVEVETPIYEYHCPDHFLRDEA